MPGLFLPALSPPALRPAALALLAAAMVALGAEAAMAQPADPAAASGTGAALALPLAALPLLAVVGLLATRRARLATASLVALALTLPAMIAARGGLDGLAPFLWAEGLKGGFIALQPVLVLGAGLFFHRATERRGAAAESVRAAYRHRRLYAACFVIGPFAESATGFGVGQLLTATLIARLGVTGVPAAALGVFSQSMVPWGALAVGPLAISAVLGVPSGRFGAMTALFHGAVLLGHLPVFWRVVAAAGHAPSAADRAGDLLWTLALWPLLIGTNLWPGIEVAGIAGPGLLVVLHLWQDGAERRPLLALTAPYLVLAGAILATRILPPVTAITARFLRADPYPGLPPLAPLHLPAFWLVVVAAGVALRQGEPARLLAAARAAWAEGFQPMLATAAFIVMAQWMMAAGLAEAMGEALWRALGLAALPLAPALGALSAFITASNTSSLALFAPMTASLGARGGLPHGLLPAALNCLAATWCMFPPVRASISCALAGTPGREADIYALILRAGFHAIAIVAAGVALALLLARG
ncbi:MAG: L-lactate permease [Alphaproteobacteria bacterium]|nr:L-lactate permease [Alphaproteobacteria bacterium]